MQNNNLPFKDTRAGLPQSSPCTAHMPDDTQAEQALYFGYGSNIWVEQMNRRCPENKYFGLGVLRDW